VYNLWLRQTITRKLVSVRGDALRQLRLPGFTVDVDRQHVLRFLDAIGERRPECGDVDVDGAAAQPDLPVPPTYLFTLELARPRPYLALERIGAPLSAALHAQQEFEYFAPVYAGDRLDFAPVVGGYVEKRGGRLGFLERRTTVRRGGEVVARLINVLAIRWEVAV
jgi:N-terminal half of MaoC dehydratase